MALSLSLFCNLVRDGDGAMLYLVCPPACLLEELLSMDPTQCMIIDLKDPDHIEFKTEEVESISTSPQDPDRWKVRFIGKFYSYSKSRLLYLTQPDDSLDPLFVRLPDGQGGYVLDPEVTKVLCFSHDKMKYYYLLRGSGKGQSMTEKDLLVDTSDGFKGKVQLWKYFCKLAEQEMIDESNGGNILKKQYTYVDPFLSDRALDLYFDREKKVKRYELPETVYFPFGCNGSQMQAVKNALTSQLSIIEGPPGTGKTQTILNIIANLVIAGKSVLVVSNNNSAIENVKEKLAKEEMDFIVALLGNKSNCIAFIKDQSFCPNMEDWIIEKDDITEVYKTRIQVILRSVSSVFEDQSRRAELLEEQDVIVKEMRVNALSNLEKSRLEWLSERPSPKLIKLLARYRIRIDTDRDPSFWFRLRWALTLGWGLFARLKVPSYDLVCSLSRAFYDARMREIKQELEQIDERLSTNDVKGILEELGALSLALLKHMIAGRYCDRKRTEFRNLEDLSSRTTDVLKEYPVVLSTTYSCKQSPGPEAHYDYVIMDESSQVDITTGVLALSCATNAVIVGDVKQLSNIVDNDKAKTREKIRSSYAIPKCYDAADHSFLASVKEVFPIERAPQTLLREHYRCHPMIINFCNRLFYDGQLIPMTEDKGEENVMMVIRTIKGNHASYYSSDGKNYKFNIREIDVIEKEVLTGCDTESLGIITPYRCQADKINERLRVEDLADTIHKYQGRECDTIIMSTVDNGYNEFSDASDLINVAVSRAVSHFCLVTHGNKMRRGSHLKQLVDYIRYNKGEVRQSELRSIFDYLYSAYNKEFLEYMRTHKWHPKIEFKSEYIVYNELMSVLESEEKLALARLGVLLHYTLLDLVGEDSCDNLSDEEMDFVRTGRSHVDFQLYSKASNEPFCAIEVDGWSFHRSKKQQANDRLKDSILQKLGVPLLRLSTKELVTRETICNFLLGVLESEVE